MNEYFDKIIAINLDRRPDRWDLCRSELAAQDVEAERFPAFDGHNDKKSAVRACLRSHQYILRSQVQNGWDRVLILEDDVVFSDNTATLFEWTMQNTGMLDWDQLYLGGNHYGKLKSVTPSLSMCTETYSTHAYGISVGYAREMLELMEKWDGPVDCLYASRHKTSRCFTFDPPIAWQRSGYSDVECRDVDYDKILKKNGPKS